MQTILARIVKLTLKATSRPVVTHRKDFSSPCVLRLHCSAFLAPVCLLSLPLCLPVFISSLSFGLSWLSLSFSVYAPFLPNSATILSRCNKVYIIGKIPLFDTKVPVGSWPNRTHTLRIELSLAIMWASNIIFLYSSLKKSKEINNPLNRIFASKDKDVDQPISHRAFPFLSSNISSQQVFFCFLWKGGSQQTTKCTYCFPHKNSLLLHTCDIKINNNKKFS